MGQQVIESNAFEGGADVLVGVGEQQVAADLFDREVGGVADQQLIVIGDREVFDGVVPLERRKRSAPEPPMRMSSPLPPSR